MYIDNEKLEKIKQDALDASNAAMTVYMDILGIQDVRQIIDTITNGKILMFPLQHNNTVLQSNAKQTPQLAKKQVIERKNNNLKKNSILDVAIMGGKEELPLKLKYGRGSVIKRTRHNKKGDYTYYQGRCMINGIQKTVTSSTQQQCYELIKKMLSDAEKGVNTSCKMTSKQTLESWLNDWYRLYKVPNLRAASLRSLRGTLDVHIIPALGKLPLKQITSAVLQNYMSELPSTNTRNKIYNVLRGSLRTATNEQLFKRNPADGIVIKKVKAKKRRAFTYEEQSLILNSAHIKKYSALFYFLCCTGLRIGEFLALSDKDIDFKNGYITVDTTKDLFTKELNDTTKNDVIRHVPFLPELFDTTYSLQDDTKFLGSFTYGMIHTFYYRFFKKHELKNVSTHSTRHTFASICYNLKIPDKYTQTWLGHATLAMTVDVYTDIMGNGSTIIKEYLSRLWTAEKSK